MQPLDRPRRQADDVGQDVADPMDSTGLVLPVGLAGEDAERIAAALDQSKAANTRRTYATQWRAWAAWATLRGVDPMPGSPAAVAAYLTERAAEGLRASSIRTARAAIGDAHRQAGLDDPTAHAGVKAVLAGLVRADTRPQEQARPLTAEALAAVKATAFQPRRHQGNAHRGEGAANAERRGRVDLALLATMRDGLLRCSEAAALRWGDVELAGDGTGRLHVRRSKGDQESRGAVLFIGAGAVEALLAIRPPDAVIAAAAPVFGLSASQIGRRVAQAAQAAGLGDGYTGHSGRVGMAQDLAAAGAELPALMTAGRWRSPDMPARYTAAQQAGRGAVARYYRLNS